MTADLASLAARFGTPAYVYDLDVIDARVAALRAALPERVDVAYAVKANPALAIVARLGRLGLGADVASAGELTTVLRAGMEPSRVVMTGPGKRDVELDWAVRAGIRAVTVESLGELERLERVAAAAGRRQPVMLRAASVGPVAAPVERVRVIGDDGAGKFGMDAQDLADAARTAARSPHLDLLGLHAFSASSALDAATLIAHAVATTRAAVELARAVEVPLRIVDVGGGLGIPYRDDEPPLDVEALGRGLAELAAGWAADPWLADAQLLLEPGRFIVGPSGRYLTRVVDAKRVDGRAVVIVDGGIHHLLRPALVGQAHRIRPVVRTGGAEGEVSVAGPLCSGLDILARSVAMPIPTVGDLLVVDDVGAYGFTESMPLFLSHPTPAEVIVRGDAAAIIRPRQDPVEWLDRQAVPAFAVA